MSTTGFTPERSAAIRQLLIDTVADEPRRRKRLQILLTSVLSGVALVLAGGTAALALSGVIHLGGDDTPPAPVPTPTQTVTPTPTPTPTPSPTPTRPLVQSAPVQPHDVDSLPASPRWSLDLPGQSNGCTYVGAYTLSDSRAVYVSGLRPKEYEGSDCYNETTEDLAVTLVDTSDGRVIWTREWAFTPEHIEQSTAFVILGTSGRALLAYPEPGVGPHDVLDLASGRTTGQFVAPGDMQLNRYLRAVPGDSGDVVIAKAQRDTDGRYVEDDVLMRVDPRDVAHPVWTTTAGLRGVDFREPTDGGAAIPITGDGGEGKPNTSRMLDLATGDTSELVGQLAWGMSQVTMATSFPQPDGPGVLRAYGDDGDVVWWRSFSHEDQLLRAEAPGTSTQVFNGSTPDTGEFFIVNAQNITLVDQVTGDEKWSTATPSCVTTPQYWPARATLDVRRDAYIVHNGEGVATCVLSRTDGALLDGPSIPGIQSRLLGLTNLYGYAYASGPGTAYDLQSGATLWTRERKDWESWSFDGGYLISHNGNHIESIG